MSIPDLTLMRMLAAYVFPLLIAAGWFSGAWLVSRVLK